MSHFVKLDGNNVVQEVIVTEQDFIVHNPKLLGDSFLWIQTSYNSNFRKQYAGVGYTYDKTNDVFIAPKPFPSWTLDGNFVWQPPTAKPSDGKRYYWNEGTTSWVEIE
jgi:hypothetical protein